MWWQYAKHEGLKSAATLAARFIGANRWTQGTIAGATAGAVWGMASDDTSVIGGALIGAGLGRYGTAAGIGAKVGWKTASYGNALSHVPKMAGRAVSNLAKMDYRGARIMTNKGLSKIRGLYRS